MSTHLLIKLFLSAKSTTAPGTQKWYRDRLDIIRHYLPDIPLTDLTTAILYTTIAEIAARYTNPHYQFTIIRALATLIKFAFDEEFIPRPLHKRIKKPNLPKRVIRGLSVADQNTIINAAQKPRDKALLSLLSDTACRVAGIANLQTADINLITCSAIVTEKGNKQRRVFFTPQTAKLISRYLDTRPPADNLFTTLPDPTKPLTPKGIYEITKRLSKKANIPKGWNPHAWRHGRIRHMLTHGMNLNMVSQIAGHATTAITGDIYGTLNDADLEQQYRLYTDKNV